MSPEIRRPLLKQKSNDHPTLWYAAYIFPFYIWHKSCAYTVFAKAKEGTSDEEKINGFKAATELIFALNIPGMGGVKAGPPLQTKVVRAQGYDFGKFRFLAVSQLVLPSHVCRTSSVDSRVREPTSIQVC
jgi:hypothetical protein